MQDGYFIVMILVQVLGFGALIWKGGVFVGTTTNVLKNQGDELEDIKDRQIQHSREDKETFEKLTNQINDLKVNFAAGGKSHGASAGGS